jgi:transcriptional regulator with XRE-family HTH domain
VRLPVTFQHLTPEQLRAGRALLKWPQVRLAAKSGVSEGTIRDFENGRRAPGPGKQLAIRQALEEAGVVFSPAASQGDGEEYREPVSRGNTRP